MRAPAGGAGTAEVNSNKRELEERVVRGSGCMGDLVERQAESLVYSGEEGMISTVLSELLPSADHDHWSPLMDADLHLCTDALQASRNCHFLPFLDRSSGH